MSANDFAEKVEAHFTNQNETNASLTLEVISRMEQEICKENMKNANSIKAESNEKNRNKTSSTASKKAVTTNKRLSESFQSQESNKSMKVGTGEAGKVASVGYAERKNRGNVVSELNKGLGSRGLCEPSTRRPVGLRCEIDSETVAFDNIKSRYRYMFTTLDERTRACERHLVALADFLCDKIKLDPSELQPVGDSSQEDVWVVGRVCCDTSQGKMNKSSVYLEGLRRDGGRLVRLNLEKVETYSLFPGQLVLISGVNSTGREMLVKNIVYDTSPPQASSDPAAMLEFQHSQKYQGGVASNIFIAAGPFTTSENLSYEPLNDLLINILEKKPDVVILIGPFVDITQPHVASGDTELELLENEEVVGTHIASYEMIFIEKFIRDGVQRFFNDEKEDGEVVASKLIATNIILIPSLLDAHHESVFPQPPFGDRDVVKTEFYEETFGVLNIPYSKDGDPRKRVHLLPNPCMFKVNEVLFGVTSSDVLFSMSTDEVSQNCEGPNRLVRMANHLIQQQSFMPQYPPSSNIVSQMDFRHSKHWQMPIAPDVLVLPSKLNNFASEVNGTVVVNPGQLAKGATGGTYAELSIHPMPDSKLRNAILEGKASLAHEVAPRSHVAIVKI